MTIVVSQSSWLVLFVQNSNIWLISPFSSAVNLKESSFQSAHNNGWLQTRGCGGVLWDGRGTGQVRLFFLLRLNVLWHQCIWKHVVSVTTVVKKQYTLDSNIYLNRPVKQTAHTRCFRIFYMPHLKDTRYLWSESKCLPAFIEKHCVLSFLNQVSDSINSSLFIKMCFITSAYSL